MRRPINFNCLWLCAALVAGCEERPALPPELRNADVGPKLDVTHAAVFFGQDAMTVPNLGLVVTVDSLDASRGTVILRSAVIAGHAALSLPAERSIRLDEPLQGKRLSITGHGKSWAGPGDGIRSELWRYQPESAVLMIDAVVGEEVSGRIEGTFWRFDRLMPTSKDPIEANLKATFRARLMKN